MHVHGLHGTSRIQRGVPPYYLAVRAACQRNLCNLRGVHDRPFPSEATVDVSTCARWTCTRGRRGPRGSQLSALAAVSAVMHRTGTRAWPRAACAQLQCAAQPAVGMCAAPALRLRQSSMPWRDRIRGSESGAAQLQLAQVRLRLRVCSSPAAVRVLASCGPKHGCRRLLSERRALWTSMIECAADSTPLYGRAGTARGLPERIALVALGLSLVACAARLQRAPAPSELPAHRARFGGGREQCTGPGLSSAAGPITSHARSAPGPALAAAVPSRGRRRHCRRQCRGGGLQQAED